MNDKLEKMAKFYFSVGNKVNGYIEQKIQKDLEKEKKLYQKKYGSLPGDEEILDIKKQIVLSKSKFIVILILIISIILFRYLS